MIADKIHYLGFLEDGKEYLFETGIGTSLHVERGESGYIDIIERPNGVSITRIIPFHLAFETEEAAQNELLRRWKMKMNQQLIETYPRLNKISPLKFKIDKVTVVVGRFMFVVTLPDGQMRFPQDIESLNQLL